MTWLGLTVARGAEGAFDLALLRVRWGHLTWHGLLLNSGHVLALISVSVLPP